MHPVLERLAAGKPVLLDGAMGTELERRGIPCPLPLWSAAALAARPAEVGRIHADYAAAGADVLKTCTFRTTPRALRKAGLPGAEAERLTRAAVGLAREAAGGKQDRPVAVAGVLAPLEDCYRPDLAPGGPEAEREHAAQAAILADCGVDLILAETMGTVREARAALSAARRTGLPVWISLIPGPERTLLDGSPLADAVGTVAREGPDAMLLNCFPIRYAPEVLPLLRSTGLPHGIFPNTSDLPGGIFAASDEAPPDALANQAESWLGKGARILGGCCGTGPAHIRALRPHFLLTRGPETG